MLSVKNVSKSFGGKVVLDKCSFKIRKGYITTLAGPNGCGKTTLFNIICGLLDLERGVIFYGQKNITRQKPFRIAKLGITRTFQDPLLFKNLTVEKHLILSVKDNSNFFSNFLGRNKLSDFEKEKIEKVLLDLNLGGKKYSLPTKLSGGQRKLLDLAVALVRNFDLILLDEPTAGVAPELRELIAKIVLRIKKEGKTVFLIEHDMNFAMKISDEVIILNNGRVLARGTPYEIKNNIKVLKAYLGGD